MVTVLLYFVLYAVKDKPKHFFQIYMVTNLKDFQISILDLTERKMFLQYLGKQISKPRQECGKWTCREKGSSQAEKEIWAGW